MNTVFTVWRSLRRSGSPFRCVALAINARLHTNLVLWALGRHGWRWRRYCCVLRWAFLFLWSLHVHHFAVSMIAPNRVVVFACVGARIRAQGWPRDIPRLLLFHLEIFGKRRALIIKFKMTSNEADEIPSRDELRHQLSRTASLRDKAQICPSMARKIAKQTNTTWQHRLKLKRMRNYEWNSIRTQSMSRYQQINDNSERSSKWLKTRCWFSLIYWCSTNGASLWILLYHYTVISTKVRLRLNHIRVSTSRQLTT